MAKAGDVVIVPPQWAHAAINADASNVMALGALCDREYSFDYDAIRKRKGLAWYPIVTARGATDWEPNPHYRKTNLDVGPPGDYAEFGFVRGTSLYAQVAGDLDRFAWVSKPVLCEKLWKHFEP